MNNLPRVSVSQKVKPSAGIENRIRDTVNYVNNNLRPSGTLPFSGKDTAMVILSNSESITKGGVISIGPAFIYPESDGSRSTGFKTAFYASIPTGSDDEIPAVLLANATGDTPDTPGNFGLWPVQLTGYVWVKLESYSAGMKYAKPVAGKTTVAPADSGPFKILSADETTMWAVALLNSGGGGGGGSVGIGRLKSLPSVGSGRGTYVSLTVNTEGELVETGAAKPVIIPRIYHIN